MKPAPFLLLGLFAIPVLHAAPVLRINGNVMGDSASLGSQPLPTWVWGTDDSRNQLLRRSFEVKKAPASARLYATCDNAMTVWINGKEVAKSDQWSSPVSADVVQLLIPDGKNLISVKAENQGGAAGFVLKLKLTAADGAETFVMTGDGDWKISDQEAAGWQAPAFDDSTWEKPREIGKMGIPPWGVPGGGNGGASLAPEQMNLAKGFRAELLYSVPSGEQGSWVSLTKDAKGCLIASDQEGAGIFRISVKDSADFIDVGVEKLPAEISGAWGMTWANDKLYANVSGKGLFTVTDTNGDGDGMPDKAENLGGATGGGEHGNHAVIPSDDGKNLFVAAGNHTPLPQDLVKGSAVTSWSEDHLLPRDWDANGHAKGILAPGGWICRVTPDGKNYRVHSMGYRNQYDIALNRYGDLFTYDADMEWDLGSPWYRPTRICHAVSGSDFGWRSGTGKWPTYYEDSLPPVIDIGPGSPTGVVFGTGAKFPTKYQDAMFALDWTFGTMYAVHLTPSGSTYTAVTEEFVSGAPLPVTDAIVGDDGALYFTTGGRGTQSALYRITYIGSESTAAPTGDGPPEAAEARKSRRALEAFHGKEDASAVATAWPYLNSTDRFLRNAARVAIESQPVASWAEKAFAEKETQARITAAVALARSGAKELRARQIANLLAFSPDKLEESQFLGLLRAYGLTFLRLGAPDAAEKEKVIAQFDSHFPAKSANLNVELEQILVYLDAPRVVERTMAFIRKPSKPVVPDWFALIERNGGYGGSIRKLLDNPTPAQEIAYAFILRNVRYGWTLQERRDYISFLIEAGKRPGGNSYPGFLTNMRDESLANASEAERAALADLTGEKIAPKLDFTITAPKGPGKEWAVSTALAAIEGDGAMKGRDFNSGRNLFHATACASCHRFDGAGGSIGPDLTTVRNKFSAHDLLESIIEPSKVISDQYGSSTVTLNDGKTLTGLVIVQGDVVTVHSSDPKAEPAVLNHSDVKSILAVPISQMPPGLVNSLSENELRDLMAYLLSRGNPTDPMFGK